MGVKASVCVSRVGSRSAAISPQQSHAALCSPSAPPLLPLCPSPGVSHSSCRRSAPGSRRCQVAAQRRAANRSACTGMTGRQYAGRSAESRVEVLRPPRAGAQERPGRLPCGVPVTALLIRPPDKTTAVLTAACARARGRSSRMQSSCSSWRLRAGHESSDEVGSGGRAEENRQPQSCRRSRAHAKGGAVLTAHREQLADACSAGSSGDSRGSGASAPLPTHRMRRR